MRDAEELTGLVEQLVLAHGAADRPRLIDLLRQLLDGGQRSDALVAAMALAGAVGDEMPQGRDFHRLQVVTPAGEGSADDLPAPARVFMQMVIAVKNGDEDIARALFTGYVGDDANPAALVILIGLSLVTSGSALIACGCPPGGRQ